MIHCLFGVWGFVLFCLAFLCFSASSCWGKNVGPTQIPAVRLCSRSPAPLLSWGLTFWAPAAGEAPGTEMRERPALPRELALRGSVLPPNIQVHLALGWLLLKWLEFEHIQSPQSFSVSHLHYPSPTWQLCGFHCLTLCGTCTDCTSLFMARLPPSSFFQGAVTTCQALFKIFIFINCGLWAAFPQVGMITRVPLPMAAESACGHHGPQLPAGTPTGAEKAPILARRGLLWVSMTWTKSLSLTETEYGVDHISVARGWTSAPRFFINGGEGDPSAELLLQHVVPARPGSCRRLLCLSPAVELSVCVKETP